MTLVLSGLLFMVGGAFIFLAAFGVYRFPDVYLKCHASTKASTLAKIFVFLALAIFFFEIFAAVKALLIVIFFFFTAPVGSHLIARAAHKAKAKQSSRTVFDDYGEKV